MSKIHLTKILPLFLLLLVGCTSSGATTAVDGAVGAAQGIFICHNVVCGIPGAGVGFIVAAKTNERVPDHPCVESACKYLILENNRAIPISVYDPQSPFTPNEHHFIMSFRNSKCDLVQFKGPINELYLGYACPQHNKTSSSTMFIVNWYLRSSVDN